MTMQYKDFEKYDPRRYLVALFAVEHLNERATAHYIALHISCTRAEAARALDSAKKLYLVDIQKSGSVYSIQSWGILNRTAARNAIRNTVHTDNEDRNQRSSLAGLPPAATKSPSM